LSALGVGFCAAVLAACSGGGGGGSTPPAPKPTNNSYRPAAAGDSFSYAGTMIESFVRPPVPAGAITPSPNPTNSQTLTTAVTQTVTVSGVPKFQTVLNPFDFYVTETDTLNGGLETSTTKSDEYYVYSANGAATDIEFAGSNVTTSSGVTYLDVVGSGNGLVDILPEVSGQILPANSAAETTTETDPDGATDVRTIDADGTYTDNALNVDGTTSTAIVNADGSGSYSFPLEIPADTSYTVSAPQPNPSGGSNQIGITITAPAALVEATPSPNATPVTFPTFFIPVWYSQPIVIATETLVDNGSSSVPATCNVPSGLLNRPVHQLVDTKSTLDPVFGETDTTTTTTYTLRGIGVGCVKLSDVVTQYYDLSGQAQFNEEGFGPIGFSDTPFQTTTTTETLGVTSAHIIGLTSSARASQVAIEAGVARFHAQLAMRRTQRHLAFRRTLVARLLGSRL
jgi:hypothetical protein